VWHAVSAQLHRDWDALGWQQMSAFLCVGGMAGFASGMLGVGGALLMTTALTIGTSLPQHVVLGTSLLALVAPGIAGAYTHHRLGNVRWRAVPALMLGSACGAAAAGALAISLPDETLRLLFSVFLLVSGGRSLWALRRRV
jgi:uncharacterized membrane protein YfcA